MDTLKLTPAQNTTQKAKYESRLMSHEKAFWEGRQKVTLMGGGRVAEEHSEVESSQCFQV